MSVSTGGVLSGTPTVDGAFVLRVVATDAEGCLASSLLPVVITPNAAPVLTAGATLTYTENDPATAIDPTVTVADGDDSNLESATVQITGNYQNGQEELAFTNQLGITGTFVAATGTLTLTGPASLANFATALGSVTYEHLSDNPTPAARTVTWVGNDGTEPSAAVTSTIQVNVVNDFRSHFSEQSIDWFAGDHW